MRYMFRILLISLSITLILLVQKLFNRPKWGSMNGISSIRSGSFVKQLEKRRSSSPVNGRCAMADRLQTVRTHCLNRKKKNWKGEPKLNRSFAFLLADDIHKVVYCSIPKVASTTWKTVLVRSLLAGGRSAADQMPEHSVEDDRFLRSVGLRSLSTFSREEAEIRIEKYFKFVAVRHPFDRIVSAYRDKIARFNPYGAKIRERLANRYYTDANEGKGFGAQKQINALKHSTRFQKIPFGHFVRYVVDAEAATVDHHWATYDSLCRPCDIKYDSIVKLETMTEDAAETILPKLGLGHHGADLPLLNSRRQPRTEPSEKRRRRRQTTFPSPSEWFIGDFLNVSRHDLKRLIDIYRDDMDLFGYEWNGKTLSASCQAKQSTNSGGKCC